MNIGSHIGSTQQISQNNQGSFVYDGKRMRKTIERRCVDFSNSVIVGVNDKKKFVTTLKNKHHYVPRHGAFFWKKVIPPNFLKQSPISAVATRYTHCSINKIRCPINVLTWTPNGGRLITGASTGEFTLWNGNAFNFETIQQAHDGPIRAMQWSHNGKFMISSDNIGFIKYWQTNMNNLKSLRGHSSCIRDLSFSIKDSKFVSCGDDTVLKIWDFKRVQTERVLEGHGTDVRCCDWHPTNSLVASGGKDFVTKLWDARSGKHVSDLHGHANTIVRVKWNRNGNYLLTAARDKMIKCYDIRFMKDFQTFKGHPREITSIDWHPKIESLFSSGGYDGAVFFWILGRKSPAAKMPTAHDSSVWDMKWHPMGHVLATGSNDHSTKFWIRNKPSDSLRDKYNISQMPEGTDIEIFERDKEKESKRRELTQNRYKKEGYNGINQPRQHMNSTFSNNWGKKSYRQQIQQMQSFGNRY